MKRKTSKRNRTNTRVSTNCIIKQKVQNQHNRTNITENLPYMLKISHSRIT